MSAPDCDDDGGDERSPPMRWMRISGRWGWGYTMVGDDGYDAIPHPGRQIEDEKGPIARLLADVSVITSSVSGLTYRLGPVIGKGHFNTVFRVQQVSTGQDFAMSVHEDGISTGRTTEARLLSELTHPHIVRYVDFFKWEGLVFMVNELMANTLEDMIRLRIRPDSVLTLQYAKQLILLLAYLEAERVVHADIKPDNILLTTSADCFKLGDFGLARRLLPEESSVSTTVVHVPHLDPECVRGWSGALVQKPSAYVVSHLSDVYALGVTLAELFTTTVQDQHRSEHFGRLNRGAVPSVVSQCLSHKSQSSAERELQEIVRACTSPQKDRPSATVLLQRHAPYPKQQRLTNFRMQQVCNVSCPVGDVTRATSIREALQLLRVHQETVLITREEGQTELLKHLCVDLARLKEDDGSFMFPVVFWIRAESVDTVKKSFSELHSMLYPATMNCSEQEQRLSVRQCLSGLSRFVLVWDNVVDHSILHEIDFLPPQKHAGQYTVISTGSKFAKEIHPIMSGDSRSRHQAPLALLPLAMHPHRSVLVRDRKEHNLEGRYSMAKASELGDVDLAGQMWSDPEAGMYSSPYSFFRPKDKAKLYDPTRGDWQGSSKLLDGEHVPVTELSRELSRVISKPDATVKPLAVALAVESQRDELQSLLDGLATDNDFNQQFQRMYDRVCATSYEQQARRIEMDECQNSFIEFAGAVAEVLVTQRSWPVDQWLIQSDEKAGGIAGGLKFRYGGVFFKFPDASRVFPSLVEAQKAASLEIKHMEALIGTGVRVLHTPLTALFHIRGYVVYATARVPLLRLLVGSRDAGQHVVTGLDMPAIAPVMANLATGLHLASHGVWERSSDSSKQLFTAVDVEVHSGSDGRLYVLDLARLLPPTSRAEFLYWHFRTEFMHHLRTHNRPRLSADSFSNFSRHCVDQRQLDRETEAAYEEVLHGELIPLVAAVLDADPCGGMLQDVFHSNGVNMRYRLSVAHLCRERKARERLLRDHVVRSVKRLLQHEMREGLDTAEQSRDRVWNVCRLWWERRPSLLAPLATVLVRRCRYVELQDELKNVVFNPCEADLRYLWHVLGFQGIDGSLSIKELLAVNARESFPLPTVVVRCVRLPDFVSLDDTEDTLLEELKLRRAQGGDELPLLLELLSLYGQSKDRPDVSHRKGLGIITELQRLSPYLQPRQRCQMLDRMGIFYQDIRSYELAAKSFEEELELRQLQFGEQHRSVAATYHNLAHVWRSQGKLGEAADMFKKALGIYIKAAAGEEHRSVAITYGELAQVYFDQGRYGEAEELHRKALRININALGKDHHSVGSSYHNLAKVLYKLNKLGKAAVMFKKALAVGEGHHEIAATYSLLGMVLHEQGKLDEAADTLEKALAITIKAVGEVHQEVASILHTLGQVRRDQGRYDEAEDFHRKALRINIALGEARQTSFMHSYFSSSRKEQQALIQPMALPERFEEYTSDDKLFLAKHCFAEACAAPQAALPWVDLGERILKALLSGGVAPFDSQMLLLWCDAHFAARRGKGPGHDVADWNVTQAAQFLHGSSASESSIDSLLREILRDVGEAVEGQEVLRRFVDNTSLLESKTPIPEHDKHVMHIAAVGALQLPALLGGTGGITDKEDDLGPARYVYFPGDGRRNVPFAALVTFLRYHHAFRGSNGFMDQFEGGRRHNFIAALRGLAMDKWVHRLIVHIMLGPSTFQTEEELNEVMEILLQSQAKHILIMTDVSVDVGWAPNVNRWHYESNSAHLMVFERTDGVDTGLFKPAKHDHTSLVARMSMDLVGTLADMAIPHMEKHRMRLEPLKASSNHMPFRSNSDGSGKADKQSNNSRHVADDNKNAESAATPTFGYDPAPYDMLTRPATGNDVVDSSSTDDNKNAESAASSSWFDFAPTTTDDNEIAESAVVSGYSSHSAYVASRPSPVSSRTIGGYRPIGVSTMARLLAAPTAPPVPPSTAQVVTSSLSGTQYRYDETKESKGKSKRVYAAAPLGGAQLVALSVQLANKDKAMQEAVVLEDLNHPNVIRVVDVWTEHPLCYIVYEYMPDNTLAHWIHQPFTPSAAIVRNCALQLLEAVKHVHACAVVHGDIKPDNVLVDKANKCLKLADFGLAEKLSDGASSVWASTPHAPFVPDPRTIVKRSDERYALSKETDMYAVGLTIACVAVSYFPEDHTWNSIQATKNAFLALTDPQWTPLQNAVRMALTGSSASEVLRVLRDAPAVDAAGSYCLIS